MNSDGDVVASTLTAQMVADQRAGCADAHQAEPQATKARLAPTVVVERAQGRQEVIGDMHRQPQEAFDLVDEHHQRRFVAGAALDIQAGASISWARITFLWRPLAASGGESTKTAHGRWAAAAVRPPHGSLRESPFLESGERTGRSFANTL